MAKRLNFASSDFSKSFERLLGSKRESNSDVHDTVAEIISDIRGRGDGALLALTARYDGYTVKSVAEHVAKLANGKINHIDNPRNEEEQHRYNLENNKFRKMGLELNTLQNNLVDEIQHVVNANLHRIDKTCINPTLFS